MYAQNKYTTHIHWFRKDLRLTDQPFFSLLEGKTHFFGLYVVDPREYKWIDLGFRKTGLLRLQFLREHLKDLQEQLRSRGSELVVKVGLPELIIPKLVKNQEASLSFMKEAATEERIVQNKIVEVLSSERVFSYESNFLISPIEFSWKNCGFPKSFSGFRKKLEKVAKNRTWSYLPVPKSLPCAPWKSFTIKKSTRQIHPLTAFPLLGGESEGRKRVFYYLEQHVHQYKETRNGLLGLDFSSKLSPYLSHGALSPCYIMSELKKTEKRKGANQGTYWLWFELLWREYFRHAGWVYGDRLFHYSGFSKDVFSQQFNLRSFKKWYNADVLDKFIKAGLIELNETGYSSNRMRQNIASFLIHNLQSNWQWGAAWFEHQLLDYDVYSNQGNWMYIAGVAFDPKGGRKFDIRFQEERYDPDHLFKTTWLAYK